VISKTRAELTHNIVQERGTLPPPLIRLAMHLHTHACGRESKRREFTLLAGHISRVGMKM
jgi:hypothetical protein